MNEIIFNDGDDGLYELNDLTFLYWNVKATDYFITEFNITHYVTPSHVGLDILFFVDQEKAYKADILFMEYQLRDACVILKLTLSIGRDNVCVIDNPSMTIHDILNVGPQNVILKDSEIKFMSVFDRILKLKPFF